MNMNCAVQLYITSSIMKSLLILFLILLLLCHKADIFIAVLAFYWNNKPAADIKPLREYHRVIYLTYRWGNNDPAIIDDKAMRKYHEVFIGL